MQRFTFHVTDFRGAHDPVIVLGLPNKEAARREAAATCADLARDIFHRISPAADWQLIVTDEAGQAVCRFRIREELE